MLRRQEVDFEMSTWDKRHGVMLWDSMKRVEIIFIKWILVAPAMFMIQLGEEEE